MHIHIVSYLPRGPRSATKRLLDAFLAVAEGRVELDHLDLTAAIPDLFTPDRLMAYIRRDYLNEDIGDDGHASMAAMDRLAGRLMLADAVVLATPMHNFSTPAIVKAWFDAVMLKGKTWDLDANGFHGLLAGKAALILASSGGVYLGSDMHELEHLISLCRCEFQFMGFNPINHVFAEGMNLLGDDEREAALQRAEVETRAFARQWIGD